MPRLAFTLVLAAALVGCGGSADETAPSTLATAPPPASTSADVADALEFAAPAVGGGEVDARDFAGTPVAFWFWAPY